jgi:hypothetical protein
VPRRASNYVHIAPLLAMLLDGEDAELLIYLANEEKDIYISVLVLVYHLVTQDLSAESFQLPRYCRRGL